MFRPQKSPLNTNGGNRICWELSQWVAVMLNTVQQQGLIAFDLFYPAKPELRLMYQSNVELWCCTGDFTCDISHAGSAWVVDSACEWDGRVSLISNGVVIFYSLQYHLIRYIHLSMYQHSGSKPGSRLAGAYHSSDGATARCTLDIWPVRCRANTEADSCLVLLLLPSGRCLSFEVPSSTCSS